MKNKCALVAAIFILQMIINGTYVSWVYYQLLPILNAWITLFPLWAFFYCVFSLLASIELYRATKLGLALASCLILFAVIGDTLSYSLLENKRHASHLLLLFLIVMNFFTLSLLVYKKNQFISR